MQAVMLGAVFAYGSSKEHEITGVEGVLALKELAIPPRRARWHDSSNYLHPLVERVVEADVGPRPVNNARNAAHEGFRGCGSSGMRSLEQRTSNVSGPHSTLATP